MSGRRWLRFLVGWGCLVTTLGAGCGTRVDDSADAYRWAVVPREGASDPAAEAVTPYPPVPGPDGAVPVPSEAPGAAGRVAGVAGPAGLSRPTAAPDGGSGRPGPQDAAAAGGAAGGGERRSAAAVGKAGPQAGPQAGPGPTVPKDVGDTTPVNVGFVGTLSGPIAAQIEDAITAIGAWANFVNARGGLLGRPLRFIMADDAADPATNGAATRRLILEEKVVAFVGNMAITTFQGSVPVLEKHGIPAVGGDSTTPLWFKSPMAFPINSQSVPLSRPMAKWALENLPNRKVAAFFVSEAEAPRLIAENFADEWRKNGGDVVVYQGVSLGQPDFTAEILRAQSAGADSVLMILENSACRRFWDAARRQRYSPIYFGTACTAESAQDALDQVTNRLYTSLAWRPAVGDSPAENEIREAVRRFAPDLRPDNIRLGYTWTAGKLFEAAVRAGGGVTTEAILRGLYSLKDETLGGLIPPQTWPEGPHPPGRCGMVIRFNGKSWDLQNEGQFFC